MNFIQKFLSIFQQIFYRLSNGFRQFMAGRYGTDKLGLATLCAALVMSLLGSFIPLASVKLVLTLAYYGLMFWTLFRIFSRNTYARYEENRRFLRFFDRLKDRSHRYFTCPKCRQTVRVPRGKGKIAITCPKCREKFIKKT